VTRETKAEQEDREKRAQKVHKALKDSKALMEREERLVPKSRMGMCGHILWMFLWTSTVIWLSLYPAG